MACPGGEDLSHQIRHGEAVSATGLAVRFGRHCSPFLGDPGVTLDAPEDLLEGRAVASLQG
jgi:hypothetical protein